MIPDLWIKFAAGMNPMIPTEGIVLRIFTKFVCSLSGTEQLDLGRCHPARGPSTEHASCMHFLRIWGSHCHALTMS